VQVLQMRNLEPSSPAERRRHLLQEGKPQPQPNRKVEPGNKAQQPQPQPQQQQPKPTAKPQAQAKPQPKPQAAKAQPKAQPKPQKKKPPPPPKPQLSEQCLVLVDLAEAPAPAAQEFDPQLGYNLLTAQLQRAESVVGVEMVNRNVQGAVTGVNLTGWLALLGVGCLVLVLCGGAVMGVRYFLGRPEAAGYTLVQKTASAVRH
jgi:outer membrane biosynthesis protein TonB